MKGKYYEDLKVGNKFITVARTVTEADIVTFSGLSGDFNPIHTDEEFAKNTIHKGRITHGLLTLAIASGLIARLGIFTEATIGLLGIDNLGFTAPVKPGDTIHAEMEIVDKRETKKPDRGIIFRQITVKNQRDETVLTMISNIMLRKKT